ncbi:MAG: tRNA uridine-5-carboxymethylaminomethyl(34) synthesis GTPase MnmE [Desulfamplus sp.]|nr:tRNA uridine-5-carboxymethylaminomethyl(34) synthesis GTPase MnmE [Desulfamplus sp.]
MKETIAAIATPTGAGGIGIIRISGSQAVEVALQIFSKSSKKRVTPPFFESHKAIHGYIFDTDSDAVIDEVLLVPMVAPRSYTAEDVVEIQAHSGAVVMRAILDIILSKGVRLAKPGEFTQRAFLNGRIDLTQAEAVADIINARSVSSLKIAVAQGLGHLKNSVIDARDELIALLAELEVTIDFPEDVSDTVSKEGVSQVIKKVLDRCKSAVQTYQDAHFLRDGLKIAIFGAPNVGKSSLMNRLLEKERSIVTEFPGTTRDLIEESINIDGIPFIISDTAGMHQTDDPVEKIGIERAKKSIEQSDMVLFIQDVINISDSGLNLNIDEPILSNKKAIVVLNKIDKLNHEAINSLPSSIWTQHGLIAVAPISAKTGDGLFELKKMITQIATEDLIKNSNINPNWSSSVVPNLRHKTALQTAASSLNQALENIKFNSLGEETLAIDIRNAIDCLGEITGDSAGVDILDAIFSQFCIGK